MLIVQVTFLILMSMLEVIILLLQVISSIVAFLFLQGKLVIELSQLCVVCFLPQLKLGVRFSFPLLEL